MKSIFWAVIILAINLGYVEAGLVRVADINIRSAKDLETSIPEQMIKDPPIPGTYFSDTISFRYGEKTFEKIFEVDLAGVENAERSVDKMSGRIVSERLNGKVDFEQYLKDAKHGSVYIGFETTTDMMIIYQTQKNILRAEYFQKAEDGNGDAVTDNGDEVSEKKILEMAAKSLARLELPNYSGIPGYKVAEAFRTAFPGATISKGKFKFFQNKIKEYSNGTVVLEQSSYEQFTQRLRGEAAYLILINQKAGLRQKIIMGPYDTPIIFDGQP